jgi:KilA-N domain
MTDSSIIRNWNGRTIRQREDGYLSATDMCQACGKLFADWRRLKATDEYLQAFEQIMGIPIIQAIESNVGNLGGLSGTWVHQKIAIRLAQWLSPEFAVWVDMWVEELLLKGKVELTQSKHLTACDRADKLIGIKDTLVAFDIDLGNPRFKQELQDFALDIIGIGQKSLPGQREIWLGVAERAEQLGHSINVVTKNRSQLGKYVATFDLERKQELRLCNGTQRPINLYKLTDDLDEAIKEFMDAKVLSA